MEQKWVKISVGFLSLLTVGSLFWGYQAQRISHQQQRQVTRLKQQNSQLQRLQARTHGQLIVAKDEQKTAENAQQAAENNRGVSAKTQDTNQQLVKTVEDVFEGLFNYTPTTYANRGAKLKSQLTPALYQQYFGKQQGNYGDGSEVTSKLTKVSVYQQSVSGSQLKVLVVAKYQSKYANKASWHRGTSVYEVTYQPKEQQVSAISSVISKND